MTLHIFRKHFFLFQRYLFMVLRSLFVSHPVDELCSIDAELLILLPRHFRTLGVQAYPCSRRFSDAAHLHDVLYGHNGTVPVQGLLYCWECVHVLSPLVFDPLVLIYMALISIYRRQDSSLRSWHRLTCLSLYIFTGGKVSRRRYMLLCYTPLTEQFQPFESMRGG